MIASRRRTSSLLLAAALLAGPAAARAQTPPPAVPPSPAAPPEPVAAPPQPVAAPPEPVAAPPGPVAAPPAVVAATPAPASDAGIPLRLAVEVEAATGVITGSFHNQLLGARLDGRFSEHLSLGGSLDAADLKGKDGRAHAALMLAVLEYMAGAPAATVRYPVRFASGYLTANGPVARLSGGLAVAVGKKVDLIGELASMVWITNNQNLLSLDLSLEVAFRL